MDYNDRLSALASFFQCSSEAAAKLNEAMSLVEYRHKDTLIHQGDFGSHIWLALDGHAQMQVIGVDGQVRLLNAYGPGEIFGAFPEPRESLADIIVQHKLVVLQISAADMIQLLRENPDFGLGLSKILGDQFHSVLDRMAARVTLTAIGRVYSELLKTVGEGNEISPPPVIAALALTAQTTRETGSRAINALERRGIIRRNEERLEILSRSMLKNLIV
ncbi:Crp/Fnr family transcriptional regulator [Parasphingorhabdus cellanae]|uniref:Crp/Fnr family transcriptional regulator n=1 Tax=Parasphingorhabdus cellanae TaxID=2806553 RepID=A0ABX7T6G9_9SPHN|nr:Crp/Fnr family transcriptional regulator [Parasphingorhabdus cellanae]QTD57190.1 Crp/Fnr family transcriptional regulator [Parasphingorhabdus cellanae]